MCRNTSTLWLRSDAGHAHVRRVAKNGRCTAGEGAAVTFGGSVAKSIVHVVGPVWSQPVGQELEVKGEITSVDAAEGRASFMSEQCGFLSFPFYRLAAGAPPLCLTKTRRFCTT